MFGSQALETAIGLAAMFFIIATAASSITEFISRVFNKRAKDLEKSIAALFEGENLDALLQGKRRHAHRSQMKQVLAWIKETSVWQSAAASSGKTLWRRNLRGPSYMSAKLFADAIAELLTKHPLPASAQDAGETVWPDNLRKRLEAMVAEGRTDLVSLKAGIESWFDEAMGRAEGAYKRWATLILFLVGLFLAGFLNLSTISTASALWQDPVTREAVANAATAVNANGEAKTDIKSVADAVAAVDSLKIPGGWNTAHKKVWTSGQWYTVTTARLSDLVGWFLTAVLVMLGAPFWFDLLGKLVSIRGAGTRPDPAAKDDSSATTAAAGTTSTTGVTTTTGEVTPAGPATERFAAQVGLLPALDTSTPPPTGETAAMGGSRSSSGSSGS